MRRRDEPIAIVGASARAAAFSALRAGLTPLTADLFADADLTRRAQAARVEGYPSGLFDWLRTTPAGTPWMYTGGLENHPDLVDEMAATRPLLGCPGHVLRQIRDPLCLAKVLADAQVAFPETRVAKARLPEPEGTAWLLKSYRGSSGSGVRVWDRGPLTGSHGPRYLQTWIEGPSGSAVFLAAGSEARLLGITRQLVGATWAHAAPFQYAGSIGPWNIDDAARDALQRAATAVAQLGVVGLYGIDFVWSSRERRAYVIEINPRYTASVEIVERMTRTAALLEHVTATCDDRYAPRATDTYASRSRDPSPHRSPQYFGKAILFARIAVAVGPAFGDWALDRAGSADFPLLADVPPAGTQIPAGRPVLTIFCEGESHADAELRLQRSMEDVEWRLLYGG